MRISRKLAFVLSIALLALSACGFDAVGCGPGEINTDGVCVLLETEDDIESSDPAEGGDPSTIPKIFQLSMNPTTMKALPVSHLSRMVWPG